MAYHHVHTFLDAFDSLESRTILKTHLLRLAVKILSGGFRNAAAAEIGEVKARNLLARLTLAQPGGGMDGPARLRSGSITAYFNGCVLSVHHRLQPGI